LKKGDNKKPVRNDENVQFVQPGEEKIKKGRPVLSGKEVPSHDRIKQTAISEKKKYPENLHHLPDCITHDKANTTSVFINNFGALFFSLSIIFLYVYRYF
jgi:hypothetical protein